MRLNLLGVRGSTPVSGPEFNRYGGHTSCVAVTAAGDTRPTVALDAGTGLQSFTALMDGDPFDGTILLSHLHWDHMQGLPFFRAGDRDDSDVRMCVPAQDGLSGEQLLRQSMAPPAFPITPAGLRGRWQFAALEPGTYHIESFTVTAAEVRHKGGRAFGYRLSDGTTDVAYLPDHLARGEITEGLEALVRGVDLLLHDAQFVAAERSLADAYGHSTIDDALDLAVSLDVKHLVLFHHSPIRTDDQLDALLADLDTPIPVGMAYEGLVLDLG